MQIDLEVSSGDKEFPVFSPEQEREIFAEYERTRNLDTRNIIFMHNTGLVTPIAMRYLGRSPVMELKDLVSEGNLGLIKAIDYYRLSWNTRFSTFANDVIRQKISKSVVKTGRWTRISADMLKKLNCLMECEKEYYARFGMNPDDETLRRMTGFSAVVLKNVRHARRVATVTCFQDILDKLVHSQNHEGLHIDDVLNYGTDETSVGFSALLEVQRITEGIDRINNLVRSHFNAVDSEIYLRYYGFHDKSFQRECSTSLGNRFGVSPDYIEKVRIKCNRVIRKRIRNVRLCDFSEERWSALVELSLVFS